MELKAGAEHLHLTDELLIPEQALKSPICGPLYMLFFHSRMSPTPVGVPVKILWSLPNITPSTVPSPTPGWNETFFFYVNIVYGS